MTDIFDYYPLSSRITFFPADIADIREVFEEFPQVWQSLPGVPRYPRPEQHPVFHKVLDRPTAPQEWQELLLPQNYDPRYLFVDVELDGWSAAISVHDDSSSVQGWISRGVMTKLLERDGYQGLDHLPLFTSISIAYDFEPLMLTTPIRMRNASLLLEVASPSLKFDWSKNRTYDPNMSWFVYDCWAQGREPYGGLDLPIVENLASATDESLPQYLQPRPEDVHAFGFRPQRFYERRDETIEQDYLSILPFDSTGHDRVVDFFSTKILAQWLREKFGIRWDDPTFYEGDSLLYTVGAPGGIPDPFTPRIPVETYHRFQGVDVERNRDLLNRGKF